MVKKENFPLYSSSLLFYFTVNVQHNNDTHVPQDHIRQLKELIFAWESGMVVSFDSFKMCSLVTTHKLCPQDVPCLNC